MSVQYPNKTFIADFIHRNTAYVIILVADSQETASSYLKEKLNIQPELKWLMNNNYPTIYDQTGQNPLPVQAKILYKTH